MSTLSNIKDFLQTASNAIRAFKSVIAATKIGVSIQDANSSIGIFRSKLDDFTNAVEKEHSKARVAFAKNTFFLGPEGSNVAKDWSDYFNIVSKGLEKAEVEITSLNDPEETASLGRIKYRADIIHEWYKSQDTRLRPVFEALGKIKGVHNEINFFPEGKHEIEIMGRAATLSKKGPNISIDIK